MNVSELIKKVKQLELKTKKHSAELFTGNYTSTFKGSGMLFHGVRAYSFGDDVRSIDWNVSSRSLEPYIKEFEEERELTFVIMIDVSHSTKFGTQDTVKRDIINEIAATLAFSALTNSDKVGVIFFSEKVEKYIPPKKGKTHILSIMRELIETTSSHQHTNIAEALRYVQNAVKKRSVIFLISDMLETEDFTQELKMMSRKHQFYAIQTYDKGEKHFPNLGVIQVYNQESKAMEWIDTNSSSFKSKMESSIVDHLTKTKNLFKKTGGNYCAVDTQAPYIHILAETLRS